MIQLTFTYGSTTVDLMANGRIVLDGYFPGVSEDGSDVTDRIDVWASGPSADLQATIQAIELALEHARQHPKDADGCWINYAVNGTETPWRSRVINGAVLQDAQLEARWKQGKAKLGVAVTRKPFWEGPETALPLSNPNGTGLTTGINVFNCNDGAEYSPSNKRHNYVDIAAADVDGNLPTPIKLMMTNTYAANSLAHLWIGHNYTDPANAIWNLEAEAALEKTGAENATCSGGFEVSETVNGDTPMALFVWSLTSEQMSAAKGQWVHAIPRFSNANALPNIRFSFAIRWSAFRLKIWQSDPYLPTSKKLAIRDMASFRLPPWLQSSSDLSDLELVMVGQRTVSSDQTIALDFLQLIPADGFRYLAYPMFGCAQNYRIVDDGITGEVYQDNGAGANRAGVISWYGDPILLQPKKLQRLYFLMHTSSLQAYVAEVDRSISVQATYRPRRASV